ncbi:MAG: ABC transporter permease [Acidobacteriota bacterium]|nr:ABC transporter permease [Acidobacteriota bacterium]
MRVTLSRLTALLRKRRLDSRLDDEVRFHIDMLAQEHMRRGMPEAEARTAALRNFGGIVQMKESYRDQRGMPSIETFLQDARYSVRSFLRTPGFTAAALITLALGIGANSAIFSVVNAVLLRPLPYSEPERIVQMYRSNNGLWMSQNARRFQFFQEHMQSFESFAAWRRTAFNVASRDTAEYVEAIAVSHDYFRVFGGSPLYGRMFEPSEDLPNGPDVAILGHSLWRRMFASNPGVVGNTLTLGDRTFTIVGVLPEGFDSMRLSEIYVPLRPGPTGPGGGFNYDVAARLRPGVTIAQANAEAESVFTSYQAANPTANFRTETATRFLAYQEGLARPVKPALLMMLITAGMLLLIACANTASLLLARASGRGREISVRAALGAARGRIVRQLMTESVLLFFAGGLLGVGIAYWAVPALLAVTPAGYLPPQQVAVDGRVLLATLALSLVTGVLFGLAPALSLSRYDLVKAFTEDGTRSTAGRRSRGLRRALVVAEIALCLLMLVGAGLLIQTFMKLRSVDPGFNAENVLTARMSLQGARYATSESVNRFYSLGLDRIRQLPGVESASVVNAIPMEFGLNINFDFVDTKDVVETELMDWRYASPEYFDTLGVLLITGRGLLASDRAGSPRVTVISEAFAQRYFKNTSPLGRQITVFSADGPIEIVGVVKDLREHRLSGPVPPVMYVPVAQASDAAIRTSHFYFQSHWVIRAATITPDLTRRIREELRSLDPKQPVTSIRSMSEVKARAMATETFQTMLLTAFASIGLLLAAAGIYGLIAYSVAQRTREFGIRLALGASRGRILLTVVRQGGLLAAAGIVAGVLAVLVLRRTLQSFVVDLATIDVATVAAVAALLLVVALLASLVPALRAVRLNPVAALRE